MHTLLASAFLAGMAFFGPCCAADDPPPPKAPPSITYGPSRSSKTWVDTPMGKVAVDEGIEWNGVKVYMSLTWTLVAVDAQSGKTLWSQNVSAFWNGLAIKEVEADGKKVWAVE